jgi:alpha-beta hydrolase superfamily lysophospholipase
MQQYLQAFMLKEGYAVVTVDYEGHGHSSGLHVYVSDFHGIVDDCIECFDSEIANIETTIGHSKSPDSDGVNGSGSRRLKRFLCGESMGGGVALCLSLKQQGHWDGVVLCAAMCRIAEHVRPHPLVVSILKRVEPIVPWLAIVPSNIGADCVHRCPEKREQSMWDPFRYGTRPRLRSALNLLYATEFIEANMSKVQVPLLIMHGEDDLVTDPECSKILHSKVSSKDKTIKMYDSVWHSFGGEPEDSKRRIYEDVSEWLRKRAVAE